MTGHVVINDVGPRDGLQNQPNILEPAARVQLIEALINAGVKNIEAGAFVSPKAVPAMAGSDRVFAALPDTMDLTCTALVPNMKGYELAGTAGVRSVAMVLYASDGMSRKNVNMDMEEVERITFDILKQAKEDEIRVSAYVSVAFGCPFDGEVQPGTVHAISEKFLDAGVDEIVVADTIGAANPRLVKNLVEPMISRHGQERLGCHFHDTRAMGLANVYAAVDAGVTKFDASIGGLGGCPFAPGASGNVATEDVVMMLEQMGYTTGIDHVMLLEASHLAATLTGMAPGGRARAWQERNWV
jgi:hydroxymethylglutaryl-CoA lyase